VECINQEVAAPGEVNQLTNLNQPIIDWCQLAASLGVPSARARTVGELVAAMEQAGATQGPFLIEADL
jgi:thiamine pyrophosphate-dependent acetolactate synthase large subunit-like protein